MAELWKTAQDDQEKHDQRLKDIEAKRGALTKNYDDIRPYLSEDRQKARDLEHTKALSSLDKQAHKAKLGHVGRKEQLERFFAKQAAQEVSKAQEEEDKLRKFVGTKSGAMAFLKEPAKFKAQFKELEKTLEKNTAKHETHIQRVAELRDQGYNANLAPEDRQRLGAISGQKAAVPAEAGRGNFFHPIILDGWTTSPTARTENYSNYSWL